MDEYLEKATKWVSETFPVVQKNVLTWSLIGYHWVTLFVENSFIWSIKTVRGIVDAHTPSTWVFTDRNVMPWSVKNDNKYPFTFIPSESAFRGNCDFSVQAKKFQDVVTADLYNADNSLRVDMSSFFHTVSWTTPVPSLYEIVIVYCLMNKMVYSSDVLKGFTLEILTVDKNLKLKCGSALCMRPFEGWNTDVSID